MTTKPLLVLKKIALPLAVSYTILLTILSLISMKGMPEFGTDYDDKLYHIFAYFVLTMIWYFAIGRRTNKKQIFTIALACVAFGIIIEALQGKLTVHRFGDLLDVVANIIGVLIATLFIIKREMKLS